MTPAKRHTVNPWPPNDANGTVAGSAAPALSEAPPRGAIEPWKFTGQRHRSHQDLSGRDQNAGLRHAEIIAAIASGRALPYIAYTVACSALQFNSVYQTLASPWRKLASVRL